ncbi:MAG TPA: hypothetical protein VMU25_00075 [Candidatus Paceibacterota bacterium]|nr:hypothetical protein [Candidatus Paceibacterota bacterium]
MIKWNEVTWYSRIGALILFLGVIPAVSFYIGEQYQITQEIVLTLNPAFSNPEFVHSAIRASTSTPPSRTQQILRITDIEGTTITVRFARLNDTSEGPATPYKIYVQNISFSKPIVEIPLNGMTTGARTFTLPQNAEPGAYSVIATGIPKNPSNGGVGAGDVAYYQAEEDFTLSPEGVITVTTPPTSY